MASVKQATVVWSGEGLKFQAKASTGYSFAMQAPADENGATPMEYLLAGVAGCTAMDVVSILQKKRQKISGVEVQISGTQAETPPNVYTDATVTYIVRGENVDPEAVARAIELSETKYCSASAMFQRAGTRIVTQYLIEESTAAPA